MTSLNRLSASMRGGTVERLCLLLLVAILAGCASKPPLPPECEGDLVPINAGANTSMQGSNDAARSGS